jgi:hypothetical protein
MALTSPGQLRIMRVMRIQRRKESSLARLNLTIPDSLYQRLDRLRDRVNVSKVCATALEKELAMLEGTLTTTDPKLHRLVTRLQRVQSRRERWDERGREDGETWAIEVASQEELREAHEEWENYGEWEEDWDQIDEGNLPGVPASFDLEEAVKRWLVEDSEEGPGGGMTVGDKMAYLAGWFDAVGHLWRAAEPVLRKSAGR